jgi:DNA invertase Pin-like site-specific DNA recombinase
MTTKSKFIPISAYVKTNMADSYCGSLQEQLNAIRYWAKYNNCEIISEYKEECESGLNKSPPELTQLASDLEKMKIRVKYGVVCSFSKISRNIRINIWFQDKLDLSEIQLISLSE